MNTTSVGVCALLILLQSVLYGFGDPISKAAYETMSVYSLMTVRYTIALAALLLIFGRRIVSGVRAVPVRLWMVPSLCIAGGYVLNNIALNLTTATSATFLRSMAIILTPILAFLIHRTRYRWVHIPLQLLVVVGLYLFCGGFSGFGFGEIVGLGSAVLLAGSLVASGTAMQKMDALALTAVQAAVSMMMALACTLLGYLLQNKALEGISSRTVALLQCTAPVLTAVFSFFLLGERLTTAGFIGAAIILLCVVAETLIDAQDPADS